MVELISLVGSIRRGKPLVGDIDILVATRNGEEIKNLFRNYRELQQVMDEGPDYIAGQLSFGIKVEVIMVEPPTSTDSGLDHRIKKSSAIESGRVSNLIGSPI